MNVVARRALAVALAVLCLEVLIATSLRQWSWIRGSLGDFLAVFVVYFGLLAVRPVGAAPLAATSFSIAAALEVAQACGLAARLHLAPGGLLHTLLGATFSWTDLGMYALGCAACVAVDRTFVRPAA